jgi:hypothetical protein
MGKNWAWKVFTMAVAAALLLSCLGCGGGDSGDDWDTGPADPGGRVHDVDKPDPHACGEGRERCL